MLDTYPNLDLSSKAQYMLGDIYMNDFRDFNTAIQEYRKVIKNFEKFIKSMIFVRIVLLLLISVSRFFASSNFLGVDMVFGYG